VRSVVRHYNMPPVKSAAKWQKQVELKNLARGERDEARDKLKKVKAQLKELLMALGATNEVAMKIHAANIQSADD